MEAGTQWRGQPDTRSRRRLIGFILLSFLLHTPLTPLAALVTFLRILMQPPEQAVVDKPLTEIPIDFIESGESAEGEEKPKPAEPEPAANLPPEPKAEVRLPARRVVDAGVDADEKPDAGADAAVAAVPGDGGADAGGPRPGQGIGDPLAVAGGTKRIVDPNANVKITIYTEQIRSQPLGARIGPLLRSVYQWRDFFGPTAIDPIRDIDRIMVVGSQLRDSSGVIAILKHNVGSERMKKAMDALATRDPSGGWIDAGVPVISARADRAERIIAMNPPDYVVVVPPQLKDPLLRSIKSIRIGPAPGSEVLTAHVETPWRILIGVRTPVQIPQSIKWARAKVTPLPDGSAIAEIEAQDESPEMAERDAKYLTQAINAATNLFLIGRVIEPVSFQAQGSKIYGTARATPKQLETALTWLQVQLGVREQRPQTGVAPGPAGVTPLR